MLILLSKASGAAPRLLLPFSLTQLRTATTVAVTELRVGHFIKVKDQLCVVDNQRRITIGRATGYLMLDYHPFSEPDNVTKIRMALTEKVEKVDPERIDAIFSYFDFSKKAVVLNDADYNEIEVPFSVFPMGIENVLQPGDQITVYRYENSWLSCAMNNSLSSKLKKVQQQQQ